MLLNSVHKSNDKEKNTFKEFYNINEYVEEEQVEELINEFIHNKKKVIFSKFLKGYIFFRN